MVGSPLEGSGRLVSMPMGPAVGAHSVCVSLPVMELVQ